MGITIEHIYALIALCSAIFSIFFYFRKPQEKLEVGQLLSNKDMETKATVLAQKEMESKAMLLANQVEIEKSSNEKRFFEIGRRLEEVMMTSQKEALKIDIKLDNFIHTQTVRNEEYSNQFTKLFTLLDERLPRNHNVS